MDYSILLGFSVATLALALAPGPDNIYVLTQSLSNGFKYGLATTAGLISGCIVHTSLVAFGVAALIASNPDIYFVIKLFGAGYLLYLAFMVMREKNPKYSGEEVKKQTLWRLFRQGFIMNVLNPKVALFFLAFFPGFLFSQTLSPVIQFYILGLLFMAISFLVFGTIALLAGRFSMLINSRTNAFTFFKWLQVIVFIGIAAFLLLS